MCQVKLLIIIILAVAVSVSVSVSVSVRVRVRVSVSVSFSVSVSVSVILEHKPAFHDPRSCIGSCCCFLRAALAVATITAVTRLNMSNFP